VLRAPEARHFPALVEALVRVGLRAVEITLTAANAVAAIEAISTAYGSEVAVGAGTVLSADEAESCVEAGASFLVAPTAVPDVVASAHVLGVPVVPGALTPTEVLAAHRSGAQAVKLFPASTVGPQYLKDIHGPLPDVRLMPTGGIAVADVATWIRAGALAVGLGGQLLGSTVTDGPDRALDRRVKAALAAVAEARSATGAE